MIRSSRPRSDSANTPITTPRRASGSSFLNPAEVMRSMSQVTGSEAGSSSLPVTGGYAAQYSINNTRKRNPSSTGLSPSTRRVGAISYLKTLSPSRVGTRQLPSSSGEVNAVLGAYIRGMTESTKTSGSKGPSPRAALLPQDENSAPFRNTISGTPYKRVEMANSQTVGAVPVLLATCDNVVDTSEVRCAVVGGRWLWAAERSGPITLRDLTTAAIKKQIDFTPSSSVVATRSPTASIKTARTNSFCWCIEPVELTDAVWAGWSDGTISVYRHDTGELVCSLATPHHSGVHVLHAKRTSVFSGSSDFSLVHWDALTRTLKTRFVGHHSGIRSLCSVRDVLLSGADDGCIKMWKVNAEEGNQILHTLPGHSGSVLCLTIFVQCDQVKLWSAGEDGTVRMTSILPQLGLNEERGDRGLVATPHRGRITALRCIANHVISVGHDALLVLYDAERGVVLQSIRNHHVGFINCLSTPMVRVFAQMWTGSNDRTLRRWTFDGGVIVPSDVRNEEAEETIAALQIQIKAIEEEKRVLVRESEALRYELHREFSTKLENSVTMLQEVHSEMAEKSLHSTTLSEELNEMRRSKRALEEELDEFRTLVATQNSELITLRVERAVLEHRFDEYIRESTDRIADLSYELSLYQSKESGGPLGLHVKEEISSKGRTSPREEGPRSAASSPSLMSTPLRRNRSATPPSSIPWDPASKGKSPTIRALREEVATLRSVLQSFERSHSQMVREVQEHQEVANQRADLITQLQDRLRESNQAADRWADSCRQKDTKMVEMQCELERIRYALETKEERTTDLFVQNRTLREDLERRMEREAELDDQLHRVQAESQAVDALHRTVHALEARNREVLQTTGPLQDTLRARERSVETLREALTDTQSAHRTLWEQYQTLQRDLKQAQGIIEAYEKSGCQSIGIANTSPARHPPVPLRAINSPNRASRSSSEINLCTPQPTRTFVEPSYAMMDVATRSEMFLQHATEYDRADESPQSPEDTSLRLSRPDWGDLDWDKRNKRYNASLYHGKRSSPTSRKSPVRGEDPVAASQLAMTDSYGGAYELAHVRGEGKIRDYAFFMSQTDRERENHIQKSEERDSSSSPRATISGAGIRGCSTSSPRREYHDLESRYLNPNNHTTVRQLREERDEWRNRYEILNMQELPDLRVTVTTLQRENEALRRDMDRCKDQLFHVQTEHGQEKQWLLQDLEIQSLELNQLRRSEHVAETTLHELRAQVRRTEHQLALLKIEHGGPGGHGDLGETGRGGKSACANVRVACAQNHDCDCRCSTSPGLRDPRGRPTAERILHGSSRNKDEVEQSFSRDQGTRYSESAPPLHAYSVDLDDDCTTPATNGAVKGEGGSTPDCRAERRNGKMSGSHGAPDPRSHSKKELCWDEEPLDPSTPPDRNYHHHPHSSGQFHKAHESYSGSATEVPIELTLRERLAEQTRALDDAREEQMFLRRQFLDAQNRCEETVRDLEAAHSKEEMMSQTIRQLRVQLDESHGELQRMELASERFRRQNEVLQSAKEDLMAEITLWQDRSKEALALRPNEKSRGEGGGCHVGVQVSLTNVPVKEKDLAGKLESASRGSLCPGGEEDRMSNSSSHASYVKSEEADDVAHSRSSSEPSTMSVPPQRKTTFASMCQSGAGNSGCEPLVLVTSMSSFGFRAEPSVGMLGSPSHMDALAQRIDQFYASVDEAPFSVNTNELLHAATLEDCASYPSLRGTQSPTVQQSPFDSMVHARNDDGSETLPSSPPSRMLGSTSLIEEGTLTGVREAVSGAVGEGEEEDNLVDGSLSKSQQWKRFTAQEALLKVQRTLHLKEKELDRLRALLQNNDEKHLALMDHNAVLSDRVHALCGELVRLQKWIVELLAPTSPSTNPHCVPIPSMDLLKDLTDDVTILTTVFTAHVRRGVLCPRRSLVRGIWRLYEYLRDPAETTLQSESEPASWAHENATQETLPQTELQSRYRSLCVTLNEGYHAVREILALHLFPSERKEFGIHEAPWAIELRERSGLARWRSQVLRRSDWSMERATTPEKEDPSSLLASPSALTDALEQESAVMQQVPEFVILRHLQHMRERLDVHRMALSPGSAHN